MATLVRNIEKALGWIEAEEAGHAALGWHPLLGGELAARRIDRKHAYAVMAAIGDIDVAAGAIDGDLGAGRIAGEIGRRRTHHVERHELAGAAIPPVGGDRGIKLVQDVGQRTPRMEGDMAWPGTGAGSRARG